MSEENPPKEVSAAQLQANRKNAKRSTGPRTEQGKRNSSRNAFKHGVLANDLVIERAGEKRRDFVNLHRALREELKRGRP